MAITSVKGKDYTGRGVPNKSGGIRSVLKFAPQSAFASFPPEPIVLDSDPYGNIYRMPESGLVLNAGESYTMINTVPNGTEGKSTTVGNPADLAPNSNFTFKVASSSLDILATLDLLNGVPVIVVFERFHENLGSTLADNKFVAGIPTRADAYISKVDINTGQSGTADAGIMFEVIYAARWVALTPPPTPPTP